MIPLLLTDGNTIVMDNSRLERLMNCMREGQYAVNERRKPLDDEAALVFGGAFHLALKLRYSYGTGQVTPAIEARQMMLLEALWQIKPTPFDNWRTLGLCQDAIHLYNKTYGAEDFMLFQKPDGSYILEEPFSLPLGKVGNYNVQWIGKLDLPMQRIGETWVLDHKTSSVGGEMALQGMQTSSQFKGYCWALWKRFGVLPKGAMVNLIIVRKPAKIKGKGTEFVRQPIFFDEDTLLEWQQNTLHTISDWITCHEREYFPMMTTQCTRKYGRCDYLDVCTLSPKARAPFLASNVFVDDKWSPLDPEPIDIEQFRQIPDEQLSAWTPPAKAKVEMPDINDLINMG